jgi:DNA-binding Lrp family transcriptional regulator
MLGRLHDARPTDPPKASNVPTDDRIDPTDARLLLALSEEPRATVVALAERTGLSRNTVQARLSRLERHGVLGSFEHGISPRALGYPVSAFVMIQVTQRQLDEVAAALAEIPEVLAVQGVSGQTDLVAQVVASDGDDLYRIAGRILAVPGVERTNIAMVMRNLVDYRIAPLLRRTAES